MLLRSLMILLLAGLGPALALDIKITGNSVVMTCDGPEDAEVKWNKDKTPIEKEKMLTYEHQAEQGKVEGTFTCENSAVKHTFYLKVKVCENCHELSSLMAFGVILGDLLITGGVILIVYGCANKSSDGSQKKATAPRSINPPRPPNPDYAALDPKMRSSNALYAGLNK